MSDSNESNQKTGPDPMDEDEDDVEYVEEVDVDPEEGEEEELAEADAMHTGAVSFKPVRDDALRTYTEHRGSEEEDEVAVFCVRIKETTEGILAVTGGQDDKARVWNVNTGATVFVCTGHEESVTCCEWNLDGTYLATGDINGLVKVWNMKTKTEVNSCAESQAETEWLEWHPKAPALLAGFRDGTVWLMQVTDGNMRYFPSFNSGATVGRILPDALHACVGYEDGSVRIWNLKSATAEITISGSEGHSREVTSMECVREEIITGSSDATAKIISTKNGKVVMMLRCGREQVEELEGDTVTSRLCPSAPLAATGTGSGSLAVWDTRTGICRHSIKHPDGIVTLCWSTRLVQHIYTACQDGVVRLWDVRSAQLVQDWHGHSSLIQDFSLDSEEKLLVTSSDDGTAKVFSLPALAT